MPSWIVVRAPPRDGTEPGLTSSLIGYSTHMARSSTARGPQRDEGKKLEILDAAANCFMLKGYSATTVDDIAEACGSTKGLVYYYFNSKLDVFIEVYRSGILLGVARVRPVATGPGTGAERLRVMCEGQIDALIRYLPYHVAVKEGVGPQLLNSLTPAQRDMLGQLNTLRREFEGYYVKVIEGGVKDGTLTCGNPRLAARVILGGLNSVSMWFHPQSGDKVGETKRLATDITDLLLSGIRTAWAGAAAGDLEPGRVARRGGFAPMS